MSGDFDGLVAVVTGGASGIGRAVVDELSARGAEVACWDVDPSGAPSHVLALDVDVRDDDAVRRAVQQTARELGALDVLVNNAGIGAAGTVEENSDDEWRVVHDINVMGLVRATRASLPLLRRSTNAAVVNTCSVVATVGLPRRALYSASKGAVLSLTLAMAADHVGEGVRVNCVNPGTTDTPWVQRLLDDAQDPTAARRALERRQPLGRLVRAEEVAAAVAYLASPRAAGVTGTVLTVDGGLTSLRLPGS